MPHSERSDEDTVSRRQNDTGRIADDYGQAHPGLKEALSNFFSSNFLGIAVAKVNRVVEANDAFLHMTGYTREDIAAGMLTRRELTPPEFQHLDNDALKQMLAKGECVPFEKEYFRKDGTRVPVYIGKILLSREPIFFACFVMDLTARREAERNLTKAREQAELYVDLMSHDINNLNQIALGYLELAGEMAGLEYEGRMFMDKSVETLQRSARLIDNVKKLQRVGDRTARDAAMDIAAIIRTVSKTYRRQGKTEVSTNVSDNDCFYVKADGMLADVFMNLVDNAIKHSITEKPKVSVVMKRIDMGGRSYYKVDVEDDGPGVPDEIKDVIFHRHLRSGKNSKGSGIGLFLVKTLVRSYGGQIWVEDREPGDRGSGARFVVLLPAADSDDASNASV